MAVIKVASDRVSPVVVVSALDIDARGIAKLKPEPTVAAAGASDPGETSAESLAESSQTETKPAGSGKVIFIDGALPGEHVRYSSYRRKPSYEFAQITELVKSSASRVVPRCAHFGVCGGCSMQHLDPSAQLAVKQRVLEDNLWHLARLRPDLVMRPVHGPDWGYRFRARVSVRYVPKKGGALVGFHERKSSYVADMRSCEVLPPHISRLLLPLRDLVSVLSIRERLPQIEYAQGASVTVMVLRIMEPLSAEDEVHLKTFADLHDVQFWLQTKGPDTIVPFYPLDSPALDYVLPEFRVTMPFRPSDFTQVNHQINRVLVVKALGLLDVQPDENVLDLFCGLGNFTLPLARRAAYAHGVEGSETLVQRAGENARYNGITNASFAISNLFEITPESYAALGSFDKVLIDPPREGALAVSKALAAQVIKPKRIVYVSCNPATLARDAAVLVHEGGFVLRAAGVVNMFPHTSHVESIAVFEPAS
jgi:23S rRNA (uracil1939-C5)-methyltransferase